MAFQMVVNAFNLDPGIVSRSERHVLLELANLADGREGELKDTCFPGLEYISEYTGYDPATVSLAVKSLIEKGFVIRQRRFNTSNLYKISIPKSKRKKRKQSCGT